MTEALQFSDVPAGSAWNELSSEAERVMLDCPWITGAVKTLVAMAEGQDDETVARRAVHTLHHLEGATPEQIELEMAAFQESFNQEVNSQ